MSSVNKKTKKNKNALEFTLVNRELDDPNYDNPKASHKILLEIPKENIDEKTKSHHQKLLDKIPEMSRGKFSEEYVDTDILKFSNKENVGFKEEEMIVDTKVIFC